MADTSMRLLLSFALAVLIVPALADEPKKDDPAKLPPPAKMTAQEDHKRMLELLKINKLRPGPSSRSTNYDEAKANPFPKLPDALVMKDGKKVTTAEMWTKKRRAEIVEDFDREVYGRGPKVVPEGKGEVKSRKKEKVGDVDVVTKRLVGRVDNSSYPHIKVDIQLTLTTPADAKGPVPVIMEFGFGFNFGKGPPLWQKQV